MPNIVKVDQYESLNWLVEDLDDDDKLESWSFSEDVDGGGAVPVWEVTT